MIAEELSFELEESGQTRIGVDGEQRSLEGLAAPVEPAPLNHTPEHPASELREELEAWRASDFGREELEPEPKKACPSCGSREWCALYKDGTCSDCHTFKPAAEAGVQPERIAAMKATRSSSRKPARRRYSCAYCGRELKPDQWIYSSATGSRYCPPTDRGGCNTPAAYAKQERARARARKEA